MSMTELRMLRQMSGVARVVAPISDKISENSLSWRYHILRKKKVNVLREKIKEFMFKERGSEEHPKRCQRIL